MAKHTRVTINNKAYYKVQITNPNGTRKTIYARTIADLRTKEAEYRASIAAKSHDAGITVGEYAQQQLALMQAKVRPNTFRGYETKVRLYIIPHIGSKRLTDVTSDDIKLLLTHATLLSESSYRLLHMLLRQIFSAAKANRLIQHDPTDGISGKGGKPQKERCALTDNRVEILLSSVAGLQAETVARLGIYAGLRREEILGLMWSCVHLDTDTPYIEVNRAWHPEHNQPVISTELKSPAARRNIPIPPQLTEHLQQLKAASSSDYVICNSNGGPLSETQWRHLWRKVTVRSTAERTYTRYSNGVKVVHTVTPTLGAQASHNPNVTYSMDFKVTPHLLRHTYITNLIHAGIDPKTVQYLAGHESIDITMAIYAKVKYNRPEDLSAPIIAAFTGSRPSGRLLVFFCGRIWNAPTDAPPHPRRRARVPARAAKHSRRGHVAHGGCLHYSFVLGNRTVMVVPSPTALWRSISPPWYWAACLTMDRPRPVPPEALEWLLSTR